METLWLIYSELIRSSQLQWTMLSVIANITLTLLIWIGIYRMEVNSELSKMYFLDDSFNWTTGNAVLDGLINGVCTILILGCVSFVMLAFVLYDFRRVVKSWLTLSCLLILFGVSGQTLYDLFSKLFDQNDENQFILTMALTVIPTVVYGCLGIHAFLANGSLLLHQFFVVCNCSLIAVFYLRAFPRYTTWFVLWTVLFWGFVFLRHGKLTVSFSDLFAVLAPMGPLKKVQEKASDYSNNILKFLMFAANENRECAGTDRAEEGELNEKGKTKKRVKQLIELYSKIGARDEEFLQKIRQRRTAINPDSELTDHSPLVETAPLAATPVKEKNSDEELTDDQYEATDHSSQSFDSIYTASLSSSELSTAKEYDQEEWNELVDSNLQNKCYTTAQGTAADALNDGETVRLGFGDFVFYSLLIGQAAASGCPFAVVFAALGILFGLVATLTVLTSDESTTPALPLPVICGTLCYFSSKLIWEAAHSWLQLVVRF